MNEYLISFCYWINGEISLGNRFVDITKWGSAKMDKTTLKEIRIGIMDEKHMDNLAIISFNKLEG